MVTYPVRLDLRVADVKDHTLRTALKRLIRLSKKNHYSAQAQTPTVPVDTNACSACQYKITICGF